MWDGTGVDEPGRLVAGRYRLLARVGRGGMGTVWQAADEVLGRDVAVKKLHLPPHLPDAERATLFERTRREARSAARITHPNVVVVHDVVDDLVDGTPVPCIVMEHVPSRALDEILKEDGPRTPGEAARVGVGMLAALTAAHAAGVLHRDVKPGNVLLGADGRVVLTDFGIAVLTDASTLTRTGEMIGSIDFCAPERVKGRTPGPASDLWALGATLYQTVEGRPPFRRPTALETAYSIAADPLEPPTAAGPLGPLIERLLAKEPETRPSAAEVERCLREIADTGVVTGLPGQRDEPGSRTGPTVPGPVATPATAAPTAPAHTTTPHATTPRATAAPGGPEAAVPAPVSATHPAATGPTGPTATAPTGQGASARRGRRAGLWAAAVVVVAALAAGGAYVGLRHDGGDDTGGGSGGGPTGSPTAPTASPSPVPDGYRLAREKEFGVAFPVPEDWTRKELEGDAEGVAYIDPAGMVSLRVAALDFASKDPLQRWRTDEKESVEAGKLPGYHRLRMQDTLYRGMPAAIWEFTWEGRARQFHAQDLGFGKPGEKEYAIYLSAPSADWDREKGVFDHVRDGFRFDADDD
ncbi:serine/threonine-protein kinase [Streptomyces phytohabitans]|uniref:serine/threonine-protein kinase n=1 Tax=Streptomyces phytohabitans TaxID=1150371 RepID=UPI00345B7F06